MIIFGEFLPKRRRFYLVGKRIVFVPMYDNERGSHWQWRRIALSGIDVISFCDKISEHARKCGVERLLDIRYFPDPGEFPHETGDPKKVFLWERGDIPRSLAEKLFPVSAGYEFVLKGANEFLTRERYFNLLSTCGIVIAPRRKEGIGMAFLEAMAMGKCVAAHDDATMNEYLVHGKTGLLFDRERPSPIDGELVKKVRANLPGAIVSMRERWMRDSVTIEAFLSKVLPCNPGFLSRLKIEAAYPLYLIEGAFFRVRHFIEAFCYGM